MEGVHPHLDEATLRGTEELLKALANPVRLSIVHELGHGDRCVHELVEALGAPQPLVSQHLRVLRGARVVSATRRGKEVMYTLQDAHVSQIVDDAIRHTQERRIQ
jgi:DNA-binding transcriptional ArsR family regulator